MKFLIIPLFIAMLTGGKSTNKNCQNSAYILTQVKREYDRNNNWSKSVINIHIQEPRVGNPQRFTKIKINNATNYFEMERNREEGIVKRIIDDQGNSKILLNGDSEIPKEITDKYALNEERSRGFERFYKVMYGLPMSITQEFWAKSKPAETIEFEGEEAYKINLELKEEMISKHWGLIISANDFRILGLEFSHPEDPDGEEELIKFEGEINLNGLQIPRIRHWYIKNTKEYLGSDIVVEEID